MEVQEMNEKIATLSVAELIEVEAFIRDLKNHRIDDSARSKRRLSFEEATNEVHTEYAHLLRKLSQ